MKKIKIIHLPWNVGGQAHTLSNFMNGSSWKSEAWVIEKNWLDYKADHIILDADNQGIVKLFKKIIALSYALKFDVVFFNFGTSLFSPAPYIKSKSRFKNLTNYILYKFNVCMQKLELYILRSRNVIIFMQYQGNDARQGDWARENQEISIAKEVALNYYHKEGDQFKRGQIALFDKFCHKIYALNPDLLHVLPTRANFLPYVHIDLEEWKPRVMNNKPNKFRIGHAPTNRLVKGTRFLVDAISELQKKDLEFEFVLIENVKHDQVKQIYDTIDVFVDQLLAGWYGGVAVEIMALGKPVVSYIREEDIKFIPLEMRKELPIIQATPDSVSNVLEKLIETPRSEILEIGLKSRKYVEKWHNPQIVGNQLLRDIEQMISLKEKKDLT